MVCKTVSLKKVSLSVYMQDAEGGKLVAHYSFVTRNFRQEFISKITRA